MTKVLQFDTFGGPEVLEFREIDLGRPPEGHVKVSMRAAGLNRAESLYFRGQYLVQPELPGAKVGFEGAGVVTDVDSDVRGFQPGDPVFITPNFDQTKYGLIAEEVIVPAHSLLSLPKGINFVEAAAFWMAFGTGYGLLNFRANIKEDNYVLLNAGSSSVGLGLLQLIKQKKARSIVLTTSPNKAQALFSAGADFVILYSSPDIVGRIMEITDGKGFDLFCDAVGGPALEDISRAVGFEASIVQYGLLSGEAGSIGQEALFAKGARFSAFHFLWHLLFIDERRTQMVESLLHDWRSGALKPDIDSIYGFDEVRDAYTHLESNSQVGKIVLKIAD